MLDKIDQSILTELSLNAKVTNLELSEKVNLSPTACLNRVRKLESAGIVSGYKAVIDLPALGYTINALVLMKIGNNTREAANNFTKAINQLPSVTECYMSSGKIDYVARVYAKDFQHFENIIRDELAILPDIVSLETLFLYSNLMTNPMVDFSN